MSICYATCIMHDTDIRIVIRPERSYGIPMSSVRRLSVCLSVCHVYENAYDGSTSICQMSNRVLKSMHKTLIERSGNKHDFCIA